MLLRAGKRAVQTELNTLPLLSASDLYGLCRTVLCHRSYSMARLSTAARHKVVIVHQNCIRKVSPKQRLQSWSGCQGVLFRLLWRRTKKTKKTGNIEEWRQSGQPEKTGIMLTSIWNQNKSSNTMGSEITATQECSSIGQRGTTRSHAWCGNRAEQLSYAAGALEWWVKIWNTWT